MKNNNARYILQVILLCQRVKNDHQNSGYALLIASVLSIVTFSMLSVFVFSTNLYKSVTNTVLESGSTFYAAETAMNRRAYEVRQRFTDYEQPNGLPPLGGTVTEQMRTCFNGTGNQGSGDLGCTARVIDYTSAVVEYDSQGRLVDRIKGKKDTAGNFADAKDNSKISYRTYSFVRDITDFDANGLVPLTTIRDGAYTGLRSQDYKYRVYASAAKEGELGLDANGKQLKSVASQTMLQMDFNSRLIPLFQFAAFYENDLEISSSSNMDLFGPVHTNSDLQLAPGGMLRFQGNVTTVGSIYKAQKFRSGHSQVGIPNQTIRMLQGDGTTLLEMSSLPAWTNGSSADPAGSIITPAQLTASAGSMRQNQPRLKVPDTGLLDRVGGDYHDKGDLRVYFHPLNPDPFGKIENVSTGPIGTSINLSAAAVRSLQQPVLAIPVVHNGEVTPISEYTRLCPKGDRSEPVAANPANNSAATEIEPISIADATPAIGVGLTAAQRTTLKASAAARNTLRQALQRAMTDQSATATPITSFSATALAATGNLRANLRAALPGNLLGISRNTLANTNLNVLADAAGGCYLPAPMRVLQDPAQYIERREGARPMNILQTSIKSMTVWNRDGVVYAGAGLNPTSANDLLFVKKPAALPPAGVSPKSTTTCDYDCMGLAPIDQTNGGLVWHFSIEKKKPGFPGYDYTSGDGTARAGNSSFGFAFSDGRRLPGALTIASNQAIYIQGDYNNPSKYAGDLDPVLDGVELINTDLINREKKPAAFLGDTITILSNSCANSGLAGNKDINCMFPLPNVADNLPLGTSTVVRAGFLAKTDVSVNNGNDVTENSGGLNNYMRMVENWGGGATHTFKYRGSFISLGRPREFSGRYRGGNPTGDPNPTNQAGVFYNIPIRDFGFDINFNSQAGLPPLTPRAVYLKQKVFKRDYDRRDRDTQS